MIFWGPEPRSTYHHTCVRKVYRYLKQKYGDTDTDYERSLVSGIITDTYSYDKKSKTWYLCEIKVTPTDLDKAVTQIHRNAFLLKKKHGGDTIVPVVSIPARLQKELVKLNT